jgi:hypothetical protein
MFHRSSISAAVKEQVMELEEAVNIALAIGIIKGIAYARPNWGEDRAKKMANKVLDGMADRNETPMDAVEKAFALLTEVDELEKMLGEDAA